MSAKELNIGDYVRTKKGIAKIKRFCGTQDDIKFYEVDKNGTHQPTDAFINFIFENEIIKLSSNIIDLIEVGDYVNGYKVEDVFETFINVATGSNYFQSPTIYEDDIESIVTKEQFESMEYKIGE